MRNGDFPESGPADRLGRMLLISMVFHVAVFGALVWYNSKTPRVKPLLPTYTVDLVNMPLPAPASGPKTLVPSEAPPPGPAAKPGVEVREKPGSPVRSAPEPKKAEARKSPTSRKNPCAPGETSGSAAPGTGQTGAGTTPNSPQSCRASSQGRS